MAIEDFFHLDEVEYAQRISRYSDQDLMKQDIVKFRQIQSGAWSVGVGLGGALSPSERRLQSAAMAVVASMLRFASWSRYMLSSSPEACSLMIQRSGII
jgi:hypothetical protein